MTNLNQHSNLLDKEVFIEGFCILKENFDFECSKTYIDLIYNGLKDKVDNQSFMEDVMRVLEETTKEEWLKLYGFKGGRPALKNWIDCFVISEPPEPIRKSRNIKCSKTGANIIEFYNEYPDWYSDYLQTRQARINKQLGLLTINNN